jgi:hypothetical protein
LLADRLSQWGDAGNEITGIAADKLAAFCAYQCLPTARTGRTDSDHDPLQKYRALVKYTAG